MLRGTSVLLSIQGLRALAAVAVVAYHALQWDRGGFDVGRAGVDVFFVISGVVMWHVTSGRDVRPGAFVWRRFTRVAPLYWLATLGVLAIALVWPAFLPEVRPGWRHLALSLAFVPHLDPRGLPFPTPTITSGPIRCCCSSRPASAWGSPSRTALRRHAGSGA